MSAKKHKLTVDTDKFTGGNGKDLFLAPLSSGAATLTSDDRLNGGGGVDTIRATLENVMTAPVMKNIERGIFTFGEAATFPLDLVHAHQMHDLMFNSAESLDGAIVEISHASGLTSLTVATDADQTYAVAGLDPVHHKSFALSIDGATESDVELLSSGTKQFANFAITLENGANLGVSGTCVNARNVTIHSTASSGQIDNYLNIDPSMAPGGAIRNLTVAGDQNLTLYASADAFHDLTSFDSSGMSAIVWASFGGEKLTSIKGGDGTEIIDVVDIGGKVGKKAVVSLGDGHDYVTLNYAFDATTQHYIGGKGQDTITFDGVAANLADAVVGFEDVHVNDASGLYDVTGMSITNFLLFSVSTATSIEGMTDKATLGIYEDVTNFLTVNMADASSKTESMRVLLQNSADLGTAIAGFTAAKLSNLQIDNYSSSHTMYLGGVGSASDGATVEITGGTRLTLKASNASTSYIDTLTITSAAGANISGLANGTQAFVSTGATISGGAGNDVLVGGEGADTISTGGGNNTVIGSAGADEVTLGAGTGADVLLFTSQAHSPFGLQSDTVENFGISDVIDIGDIASGVTFAGNFSDHSTGLAALSSSHASAYYNTQSHTLYIDLNHDKAMGGPSDMAIDLDGVAIFNSNQLLS